MRKFIVLSLLACLLVSAAHAAAPTKNKAGNWVFETYFFNAVKGDWNTARCWRTGQIPGEPFARANILGGATLTIDKPITLPMSSFFLGFYFPKKTTIYFEKNAKLDIGSIVMPTPYVENSTVEFVMRGGELTVGGLKENEFNVITNIGAGGTMAGTARFIISDGTLSSGLRIGTRMERTNAGTFSVQGSLPTITGATLGPNSRNVELWASGTLEFILDEKGVATMQYPKSKLIFHEGATVLIDCTAYKGPSREIILVEAARIEQVKPPQFKIVGDSQYEAVVSVDKQNLVLKMTKRKR